MNRNKNYCGDINKLGLDDFIDDFFNRNINEIIGTDFVSNTPYYNIKDGEGSMIIEMAAPGLEKNDFAIRLEDDQLVVSTSREIEENELSWLRREFDYSGFTKRFDIPDGVDSNSISARYENGILIIELLKKEKEGPKIINVL